MLRIEHGRYARELREDRICELCGEGIEEAHHFMYQCPELETCRQKYSELIKSGNVFEHPFSLGRMISELWDERNKLLAQL